MRVKLLLLSGAACLMPAVSMAAEDDKESAKPPVIFATDPGAAHPKNIVRELQGEPLEEEEAAVAAADSGTFDYGGNGIDAVMITAATGEPRALTAAYTPAEQPSASAQSEAGTIYRQDPIFRVAQATEREAIAQTVSYQPSAMEQTDDLPAGYISVQPGDTVFALSRRYGVKPAAIIDANRLSAPYALNIGQVLLIPELAEQEPATAAAAYQPPAEETEAAPQPRLTMEKAMPQAEETASAQPVYRQDVSYADETMGATYHTVEPGNTLFSISRLYGVDVAALAAANDIEAPYALAVGQNLLIPTRASMATASLDETPQPAAQPKTVAPVYTLEPNIAAEAGKEASYEMPKTSEASRFDWPLQGRVIMSYGMSDDGRRNDGINIAAPVGTPIRSVEDGEVVYRGSELEGYGNLLLIKHTDGWVSAYAHTDAILVQKGDKIRKGQIIAKVGTTGSVEQPQLHFELRHELKPTDPIAALDGSDTKALKAGYKPMQ